MIFKIVGALLVIFGIVDVVGSFAGFDLWGSLGVTLPQFLWTLSAYIEIALGAFLFNLGSKQGSEPAESEPAGDGE